MFKKTPGAQTRADALNFAAAIKAASTSRFSRLVRVARGHDGVRSLVIYLSSRVRVAYGSVVEYYVTM